MDLNKYKHKKYFSAIEWDDEFNPFDFYEAFNEKNHIYLSPLNKLEWCSKEIKLESYIDKGIKLFYNEKSFEAIESFYDAIKIKPNCPMTYFKIGNAFKSLEKYNEAIEYYDFAIRFYSELADNHAWINHESIESFNEAIQLRSNCSIAFVEVGKALESSGKYYEAIDCYDKAIEISPDNAKALYHKRSLANYCSGKACDEDRLLFHKSKHLEAIEKFNKVTELKPDDSEAYYAKGKVLIALGRNFEAIECYEIASNLKIYSAEDYFNKGIVLQYIGKNLESLKCFDDAIELMPNLADAYSAKGLTLLNLGRYHEAIEQFNEAINLAPDNAFTYNNKGNALRKLKRAAEEMECYNLAINHMDNHPIFLYNRAKLLNELGQQLEALQDFNKAYDSMQKSGIKSSLPSYSPLRGTIDFINQKLSNDHTGLIQNIAKLQENIIEYNEIFEKIKNSVLYNAEWRKEIEENEKIAKLKHFEINEKAADCLEPKITETIDELKNRIAKLETEIDGFKKFQAQIEPWAFKVDSEIEMNKNLKNYYEALYSRLYHALKEAENICSDEKIVRSQNWLVSAFSQAVKLTPMIGGLLSGGISSTYGFISDRKIKKKAINLLTILGSNPDTQIYVIKKTAEAATLKYKNRIENAENDVEVNKWIKRGIIGKCKDFFSINVDRELYKEKSSILGCIDALKILDAVQKPEFQISSNPEMKIKRLASVPYSHKFFGENIEAQKSPQVPQAPKKRTIGFSEVELVYHNSEVNTKAQKSPQTPKKREISNSALKVVYHGPEVNTMAKKSQITQEQKKLRQELMHPVSKTNTKASRRTRIFEENKINHSTVVPSSHELSNQQYKKSSECDSKPSCCKCLCCKNSNCYTF